MNAPHAPSPISLLELTPEQLEEAVVDMGEQSFRAKQLWQWLWQKGAVDPEAMTNLSKGLRQILAEKTVIARPQVMRTQKSADGTVKFLLALPDGEQVETVLIPESDYYTQCLSTQVGCAMGCTFCATGSMGLSRNMTPGEMASQVLVVRDWLTTRRDPEADSRRLRNLVFMGMGEPLQNLPNLLTALQIITYPQGLAFSPRRITVSTVGLSKGLQELGESGLASLAISLHAPTQELRERIMPLAAKAWSLDALIEGLRSYPLKPRQRLTFEYLLLGGVNDSNQCARDLVRLLSQLKAKVNLIAYNPPKGVDAPYTKPSPERVEAFQKILISKKLTAMLRKSKGADIAAACGQLKIAESDTLTTNTD